MTEPVVRRRVRVTGTVQGVGYRPFVYREAVGRGLAGFVRNDAAGVLVEIEGPEPAVQELCQALAADAPPLARVETVEAVAIEPVGATEFTIVASDASGPLVVPVSIDTATCAECLAEVDDPANRRHRYPFTNCTNCGPRYTIVMRVPYDRPATTMAGFTMCADCQAEYDDPADRRFHAQPNACPVCGPELRWCAPDGTELAAGDKALTAAAEALQAGAIVAIKGLGGFHLAVDSANPDAVAELRRRKARDDKPFAVMVADLEAARALCELDTEAEAALTSPRRPILLARRRPDAAIAADVAPGAPEIGAMIAYTPLHHLLMAEVGRTLVMTSGNLSDDPIAHQDDDAFARLGPMVDGLLTHNRPIHIRTDDSVVRTTGRRLTVLRRSRGYAPEPIPLPVRSDTKVLAVGAELKSTVAVTNRGSIVVSHHIGDLEHLATYRSFLQAVEHICHLGAVVPDVVAHDLHPEYLSTKYAVDLGLPACPVQHHHAHVASCLVDHGHTTPVLGVAFDGLGFGTDGTLWGGELLVADLQGFKRVGHLTTIGLPGGAAAIREPWRMAVAWTARAAGDEAARALGARLGQGDKAGVVAELAAAPSTPMTSSMGRLFDALAAIVVGRTRVSYEGQAAIELEARARSVSPAEAQRYPIAVGRGGAGLLIDPAPMVAAVLEAMEAGTDPAVVAAGCHRSIGEAAAEAAVLAAAEAGLDTVALSGGVFQNVRLTEIMEDALVAAGLNVLVHRNVPCNDGGISVGQAAIAARSWPPP